MSMHWVEHLLFFSAAPLFALLAPAGTPLWAYYFVCRGLVLLPLPGHLAMAPFEAHHWLHHTTFNYNYGSSPLWDTLLATRLGHPRAAPALAAGAAEQQRLVAAELKLID